jgi:nicotinamide mononucleotide (NMN) deamidase PncC
VLIAEKRLEPYRPAEVTAERLRETAEAAAVRARDEAGANLGLAVLGSVGPGSTPTGKRTQAYLSLADGTQVVTRPFTYGNEEDLMRRWLSTRALDLVRRYLIGALDEDQAFNR